MAETPETRFKKRVQARLKKIPNCWVVKTQQRSVRGIPDLIICVNGWFVAAELKTYQTQYKLDELQKYRIRQIGDAGGFAMEVNEFSLPQFLAFLEQLSQTARTDHRPTLPPKVPSG